MEEVALEPNRTEYKFARCRGRGGEVGGLPVRGERDSGRLTPTHHCSSKARDSRGVTPAGEKAPLRLTGTGTCGLKKAKRGRTEVTWEQKHSGFGFESLPTGHLVFNDGPQWEGSSLFLSVFCLVLFSCGPSLMALFFFFF